MRWNLTAAFALLLALAGCAEDAPACRVGADCASGACHPSGVCLPVSEDGAASGDALGADAAARPGEDAAGDAAAGSADGGGGAADAALRSDVDGGSQPVLCSANGDGQVTRAEMPLGAGLHATFRVATGVDVDTAGTTGTDGVRRWDFASSLSGDHDVLLEARTVAGAWYAGYFADATYASALSTTDERLGVFRITDDALLLLGVVSPADGLLATRVVYDPPVRVLRFPVSAGDTWSDTSTVTGVVSGVPSFYTEAYETVADVQGRAMTPYGEFDALRLRVTLTRTVGVLPTVTRSVLLLAECFGTVVRVTSDMGEAQAEFGHAAEVARLAQ